VGMNHVREAVNGKERQMPRSTRPPWKQYSRVPSLRAGPHAGLSIVRVALFDLIAYVLAVH